MLVSINIPNRPFIRVYYFEHLYLHKIGEFHTDVVVILIK